MSDPFTIIKRLTHIHRFLRAVGKQAPDCQTRTDLFERVCREAVETGRFRMAWVGILHGDQVVPVSVYGAGHELVRQCKIIMSAGHDHDPLCVAVRQNRYSVLNAGRAVDTPAWFNDLQPLGVAALAVIPLHFKHKVVGILVLCSDHDDDFNELHSFSLEELSDDISHALENLDEYTRRIDLELQLRQLHQAVESSATAVIIADNKGYIQYVNPHFSELTGFGEEDVLGTHALLLRDKSVELPRADEILAALQTSGEWRGEMLLRTQSEKVVWTYQHIAPIRDKQGHITHFVSTAIDHTELHFAQQTIEQLAYYDELTGLPNRRLFYDRIQHSIDSALRDESQFCVFYLDLDGFKHINDSLGHSAGDLLLQTVARRLRQQVRAKDTVARLGGDEFTVIVTDIKETRDITVVAENLIRALAQPVDIDEKSVVVTTSIGIAMFPDDGKSIDLLTRNADLAMYHAKAKGKNNFQFFTEELNRRVQERMALEQRLREAFRQQEFRVEYQPQVDAVDGAVIAVEAMVAWEGRKQDMLTRSGFARALEECGMMDDVFEWLLVNAGLQCAAILNSPQLQLRMAFSVPPALFLNGARLLEMLQRSLEQARLDWRHLQLEIPETAISRDIDASMRILRELRRRNVSLAIDNFGTGLSSLRHLRRFQIDIIKVDASFVRDVLADENDAAVTSAIIALAHQLNLKVLADGVESSQHVQFLERYWCDYFQGQHIARPMAKAELIEFLKNRLQKY